LFNTDDTTFWNRSDQKILLRVYKVQRARILLFYSSGWRWSNFVGFAVLSTFPSRPRVPPFSDLWTAAALWCLAAKRRNNFKYSFLLKKIYGNNIDSYRVYYTHLGHETVSFELQRGQFAFQRGYHLMVAHRVVGVHLGGNQCLNAKTSINTKLWRFTRTRTNSGLLYGMLYTGKQKQNNVFHRCHVRILKQPYRLSGVTHVVFQ